MDQQGWKIRLVILWLLQIINYFLYIQSMLFSGAIELGGSSPDVRAIGGPITFFIMCSMVWLSFVLNPSMSRWPSIVLGGLLAIIKVIGTVGGITSSNPGAIITETWGLVVGIMIVWYGIKAPKSTE